MRKPTFGGSCFYAQACLTTWGFCHDRHVLLVSRSPRYIGLSLLAVELPDQGNGPGRRLLEAPLKTQQTLPPSTLRNLALQAQAVTTATVAGLLLRPRSCRPLLWTHLVKFVYNSAMPRKPPLVFPQEQMLLSQLGERLKLARLRRKLTNPVVAQRAGISRTSLYKVEAGDPGATLGTYMRVLAVLGLEADINALAADDKVGRKLQDLALEAPASAPRRRRTVATVPQAPAGRADGDESAS